MVILDLTRIPLQQLSRQTQKFRIRLQPQSKPVLIIIHDILTLRETLPQCLITIREYYPRVILYFRFDILHHLQEVLELPRLLEMSIVEHLEGWVSRLELEIPHVLLLCVQLLVTQSHEGEEKDG